ncbi:hypothetical protein [Mucilaginibacter puniceus]
MKYLRFNFCHPVKVHANMVQLLLPKPECHSFTIDSNDNHLVEIPLTGYSEGKWKVMLDWEYDGQVFTHQKEFEIKKQGDEV